MLVLRIGQQAARQSVTVAARCLLTKQAGQPACRQFTLSAGKCLLKFIFTFLQILCQYETFEDDK